MSEIDWVLKLLGRFHPMVVHFPIGLLVIALFLELFIVLRKNQGLREGVNWMVYCGGFFALLSAVLGYLLRVKDEYSGDLVMDHQYLGISTALLAGITIVLLRYSLRGKFKNLLYYRISLLLTVALVGFTGHLGGALTHGEDYLTSVLPGGQENNQQRNSGDLLAALSQTDSLSLHQKEQLSVEVRAIFAKNCYQCHSANKNKGELILSTKEGFLAGGESGEVVTKGHPAKSELYRRVTLSPNDEGVMPKKGKVLKKEEIALIELWIEQGAHWSDQEVKLFPEAPLALSKPVLPTSSDQQHPIDQLIDVYFDREGLEWPDVVDDRTFMKRAYMDAIGLLPEPAAIEQFVADTNPEKRSLLVDALLSDTHNYTQNWLSFWNDLLRNDYSGTGFITGGRRQITDWLYSSLLSNKPYDQMVKELVNPTKDSEGFIKGIEWRGVVNSSQRTEMQAAQNIGQSLLGINVKCASCHDSFVSNLTLDQTYGFASIFADSVMELNRCDKPIGKMAKVNFIYPELGEVEAESLKERLSKLSTVMVKKENGRLYRTISNRFWDRLMGRGIVVPLDEMDNAPWDADLLDWLAADFIDSGSDLKHLMRQIMTSKTYQLKSVSYAKPEQVKDNYVFEGPLVRRLSAEQFSDAISQVVSPVFHAVEYNPSGERVIAKRIWHQEIEFDRTVLPKPGKRYFRRTFELPQGEIAEALAMISVDHSYILYLNGQPLMKGQDWKQVDKIDLKKHLQAGKNIIAIEGENEGSIANPAGVLFSMKIHYESGDPVEINSDTSWKTTDKVEGDTWLATDYNEEGWRPAKDYGNANWSTLVRFTFADQENQFARASLVKQHPFLSTLGRPSREIVTTSREDQATLLQALELTNGQFFNGVLEEGAQEWLERYGADSERMVDDLFLKSLGRAPSKKEKGVLLEALGSHPEKEQLQDVFWTMMILPEFQFIN